MDEIFKLLNPDNTVSLNRPLAHALGTNEAIIYSALMAKQSYYEQHNMLDADGYFYSTIDDLQESTALSRYQQDRAIKELTEANLIDFFRGGVPARRFFRVNNNANLLKNFLEKGEEIMNSLNPTMQKSSKQVCEKTTNLFAENLQTCERETYKHTYNLNNKTKVIKLNQSIACDVTDRTDNSTKNCSLEERAEYLEIIRENVDYEYQTEKEKIDEIVEIMLDVICSGRETIRVNGEEMPHEVVKSRFLKLDSSHIDYVLTAMKNSASDIHNIRAYLITALYNAPTTIDSYYSARVNHDMHG